MDVILLAAGIGERMQPLSSFYPKQVAPIVGVPIMVRLMETLKEVGCSNFIIVKSPDSGDKVEQALAAVEGVQVQFVVQDPPRGMGDAFRCVKEQVSELPQEFVLSATDVLYSTYGIRARAVRSRRNPQSSIFLRHSLRQGARQCCSHGGPCDYANRRKAWRGQYLE
jgi:dTDP-glucose pyrophosphorylase